MSVFRRRADLRDSISLVGGDLKNVEINNDRDEMNNDKDELDNDRDEMDNDRDEMNDARDEMNIPDVFQPLCDWTNVFRHHLHQVLGS